MAESSNLQEDHTLSELMQWRSQSDNHGRRSTRQVTVDNKCRRVNWTVNFNSTYLRFIHSPKEANVFYCLGECPFPLNWTESTNHSLLQSYSHQHKQTDVKQPCCVPTRLSCLDVEYYLGRNKTSMCIEDLVVEECGCL
ncbi:hypothetical protein CHS0354_003895 [Potamilus streckersoni]|uniref:TGF-beta family profile domain-containing protein n=1 Tax=Potamilus streckersoni TaxID=2493646 RepID=A0AAE0TEY4_9BIVA|nr:hypothetical protein CHS0354_003895 [Potamilus streckersoni]